ncbi:MAG: arylsulfatase A-like enzyme, partial [Planctomycetota bacterium]
MLGNYSSLGADPDVGPLTLADAFAAQGYRTVAVLSSSHLAHEYSGRGRGFDVVVRPAGSKARADESLQSVLAELEGGLPTFVWLHLFDAHAPYLPPGEFDRRYYPKDKNSFDPLLPEIDLEGGRMPMWLHALRDHAFARSQYRAEIAYLDAQIAGLLAHPRVDAGIIAFTSDHGEVFARNGVFYEHKGLTPDTLRVPLIVRAPGLDGAGRRVTSHVRQMDLGRTLLNLAGHTSVEYPGLDLLDEKRPGDEPHFAISRRFASVTQGKWHAI